MVNKNTQNNETGDSTPTSSEAVVESESEPSTSVCRIKDETIEKFTKVSKSMVRFQKIVRDLMTIITRNRFQLKCFTLIHVWSIFTCDKNRMEWHSSLLRQKP